MSLQGKDVISIRDLNKKDVEDILSVSEKMIYYLRDGKKLNILDDKIMATLFFEPSTRTRLSFTSAMQRLGGSVLGFSSTEGTSVAKGETLSDTAKNVEKYVDCIVVRHPIEGSARLVADSVNVPVINGGDGSNQHPTQALLDLFTIKREKGLKGTKVAICGDLKYGRTVHSLAYVLSMFGIEIVFVSPEQLAVPKHVLETLDMNYGIRPKTYNSIDDVIEWVDVLYVTRIQRERFVDPNEYEKVAGSYYVDKKILDRAKKDLIVLHPLPRVDEIKREIDSTSHAKYFDQAWYGVAVRMALLSMIFGRRL